MAQRFEAEEIDGVSLDYLRRVHETRGEGMPGVYLDAKAANLTAADLPGCGAIVGLILLPLTLFVTWMALYHDPFNVAMLLTAGLVLSVWLIVAWVRTRIEQNRADYIGHFKYVDALYIWQGGGRGVWVTPLSGLRDAEVTHTHGDQGEYKNSTIHARLEQGTEDIVVQSEELAHRLQAYLRALPDMRGSPVERGYAAIDAIDDRYDPSGYLPPRERVVDAIPEPHRARRAFGAWKYLVVLALFGLTYLVGYKVCVVLRDHALADLAMNRGNQPLNANDRILMLRYYLADPRNTRHRGEVEQALGRFHEDAAARLQGGNRPQPKLNEVLANILRDLKHDSSPVITVSVRAENESAPESLVNDLGRTLSQVVGEYMAAFGGVREGPANVELKYTKAADGSVDWVLTMGVAPGAKDAEFKTKTPTFEPNAFLMALRQALGQP